MTKNLMIVESPSKIKSLSKYLGKEFAFEASMGHVRDLLGKQGSVDVGNNFQMSYEVKSKAVIKKIISEAKKADVLFLATDPDREGEAIAWHIMELIKEELQGKVFKRVSFQSITKESVISGIESAREIDMHLVNSQQARRALDYLVGFGLSPLLWSRIPGAKSAGRVQSVALSIVCKREKEVLEFTPKEFWEIEAKFQEQNIKAKLTHLDETKLEKFTLSNENLAQDALKEVKSVDKYKVISVKSRTEKRMPYAPFITSTLQQDAFAKLGFSPKKTMTMAQQLYENGFITYMRTDSTFMVKPFVVELRKYIQKSYGQEYLPEKQATYPRSNSQEAHEAIRVTSLEKPKSLPSDQNKLYELIWGRTIACQMKPLLREQCKAICRGEKAELQFNGSVLLFLGFAKVYPVDLSEDNLIQLKEGQLLHLENAEATQHFTKAPPRYKPASLIKALEEKAIGRPSTYAPIISILETRGYCSVSKNKELIPQGHGWIVVLFLEEFFTNIMEYGFTAQMEESLDQIARGKAEWKSVLSQFWKEFDSLMKDAETLRTANVIDHLNPNLPLCFFPKDKSGKFTKLCPECGKNLGLKIGGAGSFIGCSGYPDCKYAHSIGSKNSQQEIGEHSKGGMIYVKVGRYGSYLHWENQGKVKRASVKSTMTLEEAEKLLELPRNLGQDPDTGLDVLANMGRFGPCLSCGKTYVSIKLDQLHTIELKEAVELIKKKKTKKK